MSTNDEQKAQEFADREIEQMVDLEVGTDPLRPVHDALARGYLIGMKRGRAMGKANAVRQFQTTLPAALREQQARAWDEGWDAGLTHVTPAVNPYRDE